VVILVKVIALYAGTANISTSALHARRCTIHAVVAIKILSLTTCLSHTLLLLRIKHLTSGTLDAVVILVKVIALYAGTANISTSALHARRCTIHAVVAIKILSLTTCLSHTLLLLRIKHLTSGTLDAVVILVKVIALYAGTANISTSAL